MTHVALAGILFKSFVLLYIISCAQGLTPQFKTLQFAKEPRDTVVKLSEKTVLECNARYDNKEPSVYSWERNNELLTFWSSQASYTRYIWPNGSLYFDSVKDSGPSPDTGNYQCIAEVTEGSKVNRIATPAARLSIADAPSFRAQPGELVLRTGDTAMFKCKANGRPKPTHMWLRNGAPINLSSSRVIVYGDGEVLEIRQVTSADSGQYRCRAENMAGSAMSSNYTLTVQSRNVQRDGVAPGFVMHPWDTTALLGSETVLYCVVNGTDSNGNLPTVTWLVGGATVNTSGGGKYSIVGSGSLRITNLTESDSGKYICRGENVEDVTDAEADLIVQVPPYFVKTPQNKYGRVNDDIELECEVHGVPEPYVYWLKDSDMVRPSQYFRLIGGNLKIMGLMQSDAGYFQCFGENEVGKAYAVAQLIVIEEESPTMFETSPEDSSSTTLMSPASALLPPPPSNLQAVFVSQSYVTLSWSIVLPGNSTPITAYTVSSVQAAEGSSRVRSVNTSSTDYTVEGLLPGAIYTFQVASYNRYGRSSKHTEIRVKTQEELSVPDSVQNFRVWAVSHELIKVSWEAPLKTNGEIINYRVYYYSHNQSQENFKVVTSLTATLTDLSPYTDYYVRVEASNENGPGSPSEEVIVKTFSAKPSGAPQDVGFEVISTTAIQLKWSAPLGEHQNGMVTGYKIRCKSKSRSSEKAKAYTTDAVSQSFVISELDPGMTYMLRVAAFNVNGTGDFSPWLEATTYTVELDETRPPNKPSYIQTKAYATDIVVSWAHPEGDIRRRGYKLGYGIVSPDEKWVNAISPVSNFYTITGLKPSSNYVVQILAYNNAGEGESAQQQIFTRDDKPTAYELKIPTEVIVNVISSTSVLVRWYDPTLGQNQRLQDDRVYTVKYNALTGLVQRKTLYVNTTDLFVSIDGLRPYTKYEFSVMIAKGNRASLYSLTARNTTFEAPPSDYPEDLTVTALDFRTNYLMVSWQPPSRPNGKITAYFIYSNTNSDQPLNEWIVEDVPGHVLNHEFGPVTPQTIYYFKITAQNSKGISPPSPIKVVKTLDASLIPINIPLLKETDDISDELNEKVSAKRPLGQGGSLSTTPANGLPSSQVLWKIIASVSAVTALAIAALVVVLCRKRLLYNRNKRANLKASNQAPKGMNKLCKQQPDNLWINQEQVELKAIDDPLSNHEPDEHTCMLNGSHSHFDMNGGSQMDEPRYSTLGRQRTVIIASQPHRDAMPRATVMPMTVESNRPMFPRTQFSSQAYGSTPRVHIGDTSQPMSESFNHMSTPMGKMNADDEIPPPRPPPMEARFPLRSFSIPAPPPGNNIPKHIVKPQPISYKPPLPPPVHEHMDNGSLKRPPRPPYSSRLNSQSSLNSEPLKIGLKTTSTEHLSSQMADIDHIMQDLNAITHDIQCT